MERMDSVYQLIWFDWWNKKDLSSDSCTFFLFPKILPLDKEFDVEFMYELL